MIVNFSVGNYLSFKDVQTLNLVPDPLKELPENQHIPYLYDPNERLLKSIAIYGHNSHGKTNLLKAFRFFHDLIFTSFSAGQVENKIDISQFRLNTSMVGKPSFFEITFIIKETRYRYRAQLTENRIIEEGLYYAEAKIRENFLFVRVEQDIRLSKSWNKENNNQVERVMLFAKPHILFLSVLLSQEKISRINQIFKWLQSNIFISDDYRNELKRARSVNSELEYRDLIRRFIRLGDLGFVDIYDKIEKTKKSKNFNTEIVNTWYDSEIKHFDLYTIHDIYDERHKIVDNVEFEFQKSESAGSIKYFIIVSLLALAIKKSQIIWIDELDARMHSKLLTFLVQSFHNPKINATEAQMIFTTHNTIIMDRYLRRDQMVAVTKNEWGESVLERIHTSKKPIKTGKSVEKEYRKGNLSGVSKKVKDNPDLTLFD